MPHILKKTERKGGSYQKSERQKFVDTLLNAEDPLVMSIATRMIERYNDGTKKYGDTMMTSMKSIEEWCDEAIEELLDGAVYLEKLKRMIQDMNKWNAK